MLASIAMRMSEQVRRLAFVWSIFTVPFVMLLIVAKSGPLMPAYTSPTVTICRPSARIASAQTFGGGW